MSNATNEQIAEHQALFRAENERGVRAHPARFIVLPGHVFFEAERVIEEHDGYLVVEKNEDVRAVVERTDPRAV
jgi:hypothetical protein